MRPDKGEDSDRRVEIDRTDPPCSGSAVGTPPSDISGLHGASALLEDVARDRETAEVLRRHLGLDSG